MKEGQAQTLVAELSDGISDLKWDNRGVNLVATSWDGSASVFDAASTSLVRQCNYRAPLLCCDFWDDQTIVVGGLDHKIKATNLSDGSNEEISAHEDAVSCLTISKAHKSIFSGSWDRTIKRTDYRQSGEDATTVQVPGKVYAMDLHENSLVVALSDRQNWIFDVRKMKTPVQRRTSSLRYTTRAVACMPDGKGYATSSIEGRIAVEFFDQDSQIQAQAYAFKCHRQKVDDHDVVYPVNALAFHPLNGTFVSGGGDGHVSVWDPIAKKRRKQYPNYDTGISALDFSFDGSKLAIASSSPYVDGKSTADATTSRHAVWVRSSN